MDRFNSGGSPTEIMTRAIDERRGRYKNDEIKNTTNSTNTAVTDDVIQRIVNKLATLLGADARITHYNKRRKRIFRWTSRIGSITVGGINPTIDKRKEPYIKQAKELENDIGLLVDDTTTIANAIRKNEASLEKLSQTIQTTTDQITTIAQDIEKYKLLLEKIKAPGPSRRSSLDSRFNGDGTALDTRRALQQQKFGLSAFEYLTQTNVTKILKQLQTEQDKLNTIIQNTETTMKTINDNITMLQSLPSLADRQNTIANHLDHTYSLIDMYERIQFGSTIGGGLMLLWLFHKLLGMASDKHHQYDIDGKRLRDTLLIAVTLGLVTYGLGQRLTPIREQAIQQQTPKSH